MAARVALMAWTALESPGLTTGALWARLRACGPWMAAALAILSAALGTAVVVLLVWPRWSGAQVRVEIPPNAPCSLHCLDAVPVAEAIGTVDRIEAALGSPGCGRLRPLAPGHAVGGPLHERRAGERRVASASASPPSPRAWVRRCR
jgi:hypothetical protein